VVDECLQLQAEPAYMTSTNLFASMPTRASARSMRHVRDHEEIIGRGLGLDERKRG